MKRASELTDDELRIMIAEACGWKNIYRCGVTLKRCENGMAFGKRLAGTKDPVSMNYAREYQEIPRYTTDLNAMNVAWETLSFPEKLTFEHALRYIAAGCVEWVEGDEQHLITNATARQRAEAFVITKNLALR